MNSEVRGGEKGGTGYNILQVQSRQNMELLAEEMESGLDVLKAGGGSCWTESAACRRN